MKRVCNGCKALRLGNGSFYCVLGYNVEQVGESKGYDIPVTAKPLEDCPKPTSNKHFNELFDN